MSNTKNNKRLWYNSPAREYIDGLPIGNGRLAAMVYGSYKRERVALNHEWLWTGVNRRRENEKSAGRLPGVRKLLLEGKYAEAALEANRAFAGGGGRSGRPNRVDPYQPAGDLYMEFNHGCVHEYLRELDLETASVHVSYKTGRGRFNRYYIAHQEKGGIISKLDHDGEPFDCALWLDRNHDSACGLDFSVSEECIAMRGRIEDGVEFSAAAEIRRSGGTAEISGNGKLILEGITEAVIFIDAAVDAGDGDIPVKPAGGGKNHGGWDEIFRSHVRAYRDRFFRMGLEVELPGGGELPTDERIREFKKGHEDPGLVLLYFNYGRYLLLSSSPADSGLPANLQGKWNEDLSPPWKSDYHHDINLQMCYWLAEPAGMQDCAEPLFRHIERFIPHAEKAAMDLYGCRGVWFPIQTDPWGRSTPESYGYAAWIGAAPWLARHMWLHFEYGRDRQFLEKRAYPFLKKVAEFYEDYLVEDENGVLQILPSQSPENMFAGGGEFPVSLCVSSAMDITLARETLGFSIAASEILGVDFEKRNAWKKMLERLSSLRSGPGGYLLEWGGEFEEVDPGHRHFSHLYGLFPGDLIAPDKESALCRAAEAALERRMKHGAGQTGWSCAWAACLFARLGRAEDAWGCLTRLISGLSTDTLLDLHPPRIFQIDGNLGGAACVTEMLVQCVNGKLLLLPALPTAWPAGRVSGIRARGGYSLDIEWENGRLATAGITGKTDGKCAVDFDRDQPFRVADSNGEAVFFEEKDGCISFDVRAGERYKLIRGHSRPAEG